MSGTPTNPIEAGTELDYLLRCVADGLGALATHGYAAGDKDRDGRAARSVACKPFSGQLSEKMLKEVALESPAMRVSITAFPKTAHAGDGSVDLTVQFAAVLVVASRALDWDGVAARTMQAVMAGMHWRTWGTHPDRLPFLFPKTEEPRAENLFGDMIIKTGVTMWALAWQQVARVRGVEIEIAATSNDTPGELFVKACPPYGESEADYIHIERLTDWPA